MLIVAQPGVAPLERGHLAALASAVCFALNTIYTRRIMAHDSVLCVLFWMTLLQGSASLLLSLPGGIPVPAVADLPWIAVIGLTGLSAHYSLTSALGHAPASIVAPMEFIRLPVITMVGTLLYGEPLEPRGLRRRRGDHRRQPRQPARRDPPGAGLTKVGDRGFALLLRLRMC